MSLDLNEFKTITLQDKKYFREMFHKYNVKYSEFNFNTLFCWDSFVNYRWTTYNDRLFIYASDFDLLYMPVGSEVSPVKLKSFSDDLRAQGKSGKILLVEKNYVVNNTETQKYFEATIDRDRADYVYSVKAHVELKGNKLHKKKNLLSQFQRLYEGALVNPLAETSLKEACLLAEKWCKERNCLELGFNHENSAIKKALMNFKALELEGIEIRFNEKLIAFSIVSRQTNDMYTTHYEKFDYEYKGVGQAINFETAKWLSEKNITYVNREQDLGIEGLRQAKLSYEPVFLLDSYLLTPKG